MSKPEPRLPSPYRPDRLHPIRTAVLLALTGSAAVAGLAYAARAVTGPVHVQVPVQTYDPGLYTPEPESARPQRPPHPADAYTPPALRIVR